MKWKTFWLLLISVFSALFMYHTYAGTEYVQTNSIVDVYNQLHRYRLLFYISLSCFFVFGFRTGVVHDLDVYMADKKFVIYVSGALLILTVFSSSVSFKSKVIFTSLYAITYLILPFLIKNVVPIERKALQVWFFFIFCNCSFLATIFWLSGYIRLAFLCWVLGILIFLYGFIINIVKDIVNAIGQFLRKTGIDRFFI